MKEIHEDEVLFEKNDEDLVIVATTSSSLSYATFHNMTMIMKNFHKHNLKISS